MPRLRGEERVTLSTSAALVLAAIRTVADSLWRSAGMPGEVWVSIASKPRKSEDAA